jgi:catechol 2,3-dioxygenase-like lactoylglutathione lyase family enzyme
VDYRLEAIVLPVADVDRAKEFYERAGFRLDVDSTPTEGFRVVQFTPPGSDCSILFGTGLGLRSEPGSYGGLHLVVTDIEAAREELAGRGVSVSEPYHWGPEGKIPGPDPEHQDYGSYVSFPDPDGNGWLLQEVPSRAKRE